MKKIIIILLTLVLVSGLVGCDATETSNETNKSNLKTESDSHIYIWTDKETGVQYIVY